MEDEKMVQTPMGLLSESDIDSELKLLKNSWDMYERTKEETLQKRNSAVDKAGNKIYSEKSTAKTMELLEAMQADIKDKYISLGGDPQELLAKPKRGRKKKDDLLDRRAIFKQILETEKRDIANGILDESELIQEVVQDKPEPEVVEEKQEEDVYIPKSSPIEDTDEAEDGINVNRKMRGKQIKYDIIPLPSKGLCYKNKIAKIPVSYLTAYDENIIISPNMYKDGTFIDEILKEKVMTDDIDPNDMVPGDRDAIILWLRASGYGVEFPVTATDPTTGKEFNTTVDLTKLKYKKFNLKSDENGHFDFTLPASGDKIKFKFLTYKDVRKLEKMEEDELISVKKFKIMKMVDDINDFILDDNDMEAEMKTSLVESAGALQKYSDVLMAEGSDVPYTHSVTNRLAASIVSINGVTDRKYIEQYVMYMNVIDSTALRKYIMNNEPGVDFNIEIERPKSLGGGSINMFLQIDQYIFLSVAG